MFTQIEDSVKVVVEKSQQGDSAKIDALSAQVHQLSEMVRRLETGQSVGVAAVAHESPVSQRYTFEELRGWLQNEHRVSDAFEAALEARDPTLLEQLCSVAKPREVIANCSQAILLCIVQQLSVDLPVLSNSVTDAAVERLNLRANWLKQCTLQIKGDEPTTRKHLSKTLTKVKDSVQQVCWNTLCILDAES